MSNGGHILVCDDDAHIRFLVTAKLRAAGYEVEEARDGEEGLQAACRVRPVLILTDFQMPRMTGLQMCEALKKNNATSDIPVIMLTARGYSIPDEQLARTSILQVIDKPFGVKQLMARVEELLASRRGRGEGGTAAA